MLKIQLVPKQVIKLTARQWSKIAQGACVKKKQRSIPVQYVIPQTMVDQLPNMYKIYVRFMTLKHFSFQLSLLPLVFSLFLRSSKVFFF